MCLARPFNRLRHPTVVPKSLKLLNKFLFCQCGNRTNKVQYRRVASSLEVRLSDCATRTIKLISLMVYLMGKVFAEIMIMCQGGHNVLPCIRMGINRSKPVETSMLRVVCACVCYFKYKGFTSTYFITQLL